MGEREPDGTWLGGEAGSLDDLAAEIAARREAADWPHASRVERGIPVYDAARVSRVAEDAEALRRTSSEWTRVLLEGPGVLVFEKAIADREVLDGATRVLEDVLRAEREAGAGGDHFAEPGANSRIWNAHEKLCLADPEAYARYNAGDVVPAISRAWLGPLYQVTAQVNLVRPGAPAQRPHRDYHMGFQTREQLLSYPAHVHRMTPLLTLQGAVAHVDMPIESGPTRVLPFSQAWLPGYLAAERPGLEAFFEEHCVQLPLGRGDMMFLSPALFHAAGANRTRSLDRFANLLQISSSYGRAMESLDRARMCAAVYPVLLDMKQSGALAPREVENVVAATAEGYPFPVNLDRAPPVSGMAPPSQQDLFRTALCEEWDTGRFRTALADHAGRRVSR